MSTTTLPSSESTATRPTVSGLAPAAPEELDPEERMSRAEIQALQLERLLRGADPLEGTDVDEHRTEPHGRRRIARG